MYQQPIASPDAPPSHGSEEGKKWINILIGPLGQVARQVHTTLTITPEALEYVESMIHQLLDILCACQPHTFEDVEHRVQKTFPHPIDKWAIQDAVNALDKGKKKTPLVLPVDKIHQLLKEKLGYKVDHQVTVYIVAVLEYIAADILKLTGNYVKTMQHKEITLQDVKVAMNADKVLMDMFFQDCDDDLTLEEELDLEQIRSIENQTYEDIVKDLILDETQYMRDLNMIIKVFMEPFVQLFPTSQDIENIFSNILDLQVLTYNLLSSLEDTKEMCEETDVPLVGACFEDIAEGAEFEVYRKYTEDNLGAKGRTRLNVLLQRPDVIKTLDAAGYGFKDAVRYVLPKLLMGPIYHCLRYLDTLTQLGKTSEDEEDGESISQAKSMMHPLKVDVERKLQAANLKRQPGDIHTLRFQRRADKMMALNKMNYLQISIDGWDGKNISQSCHMFLMEGVLQKYSGRRLAERYVFLFDWLIIFTKPNNQRRSSVTVQTGEYRLKDKFHIRRVDVIDRPDDELKNSFELVVRDHPNIILVAKTAEEKANWMAALISLLRRSMLERMLDTRLGEETRQQPLRLPSPDIYRFAEEDSDNNIVIEDSPEGASTPEGPQIKGGTLVKLVERLTYHTYAEPKFLRTFLTTYRTFCKPCELLDLLIERFNIPELELGCEDAQTPLGTVREDVKRFRKEYMKPVQFRVLNVLRHWVDQHWYDFAWNTELLNTLQNFLESVKAKAIRKWVDSINKIINRKLEWDGVQRHKEITFPSNLQKPKIEWHIATANDSASFDLMTLHPLEMGRQVTLLEFDLYRAVKPSELVGTVWVKKQKYLTSPNLLRGIDHSTRFTFWLEKCILECENFEERVAVVARILEIMCVFQELNNFNGILEVLGALGSAPIHRLEHTFEEVDQKHHKLMKAFDEARELCSDHFKKYYEKLRSINPPCVPFLGNYLTSILMTEEGNPDFLPNSPDGLINFSKRRKVAEICSEIQQYQNQPYCLEVEPSIRLFFESLRPLGDRPEKEFTDELYEKSLELEPRNAKPAKYERKRMYSLKSPGIKPLAHSRHSSVSTLRGVGEKLLPAHSQMSLQDGTASLAGDMAAETASMISCRAGSIFGYQGGSSGGGGRGDSSPCTPLASPHSVGESEFSLVTLPQDRATAFGGVTSPGGYNSNFSSPKTLVSEELALPPRRLSTTALLRDLSPRMEALRLSEQPPTRPEPRAATQATTEEDEDDDSPPPLPRPRHSISAFSGEDEPPVPPRPEPRQSIITGTIEEHPVYTGRDKARNFEGAVVCGVMGSGVAACSGGSPKSPHFPRGIGARGLYYAHPRQPPPPPLDLDAAPPLPPRKQRTGSSSSGGTELSPLILTPTGGGDSGSLSDRSFELPPHPVATSDEEPPELPPRREPHLSSALNRQFGIEPMTLPRHTRIPYHPNATKTLPRRNSERDYNAAQPKFVNVNGDGERGGSVTPQLPPKTYLSISHSRQQSS